MSAFYYDYTNLQVGFVNENSIVETINAASARNYGLGNWACHRAMARGILHYLMQVRGEQAGSSTHRIPGLT